MQARTNRRPGRDVEAEAAAGIERLRECMDSLVLDAVVSVPSAKMDDTIRRWLARAEPAAASRDDEVRLVADALGMVTDLAVFTPSAGGQTAFDRLARQRPSLSGDERAAVQALRQAEFRLLRFKAAGDAGAAHVRDHAPGVGCEQ